MMLVKRGVSLGRGLVLGAAVAMALGMAGAQAFEVPADEQDKLKVCEKALCELIVNKAPAEGNLTCELSKTWAKSFIEDGIKAKQISWGLGDARCTAKIDLSREAVVKALTEAEYELAIPPQPVKCEAETGETVTAASMTIAPKIRFKAGEATSATLGVADIEAPAAVKGVIWSVTKIEDTVGLFQGALLKEINKFVRERCPKTLAGQ